MATRSFEYANSAELKSAFPNCGERINFIKRHCEFAEVSAIVNSLKLIDGFLVNARKEQRRREVDSKAF
jgi:hypothetical protein